MLVLNITTKNTHDFDHAYMLWHKRLCNISKERVLHMAKINLIPLFNFKIASNCVDCIIGKLTNVSKLYAKEVILKSLKVRLRNN